MTIKDKQNILFYQIIHLLTKVPMMNEKELDKYIKALDQVDGRYDEFWQQEKKCCEL